MHILSINIGTARTIGNAQASEKTGIYKLPVDGPVQVTAAGLPGDAIVSAKHHGGPDQAVYIYGGADYAWWSAELGRELAPGTFGENLTISNLKTAGLAIGDRLHVGARQGVGGVILEVTAPRIPCGTFEQRMGIPGFAKRFRAAERPGAYCRVVREGAIQAGDPVMLALYAGDPVTVAEVFRDYYEPDPSPAAIRRFLAAPLAIRARKEKERQLHELESMPSTATTAKTPLPRSTPEAQGIASSAITAFLTAAEQGDCGLHSFMLLRHGHVVAEGWWSPYAPDAPHMLFSLSKSFTSTAVGMAVAEGRLSVDDPVLTFFPAEAPAKPSENLAAMRVRHLLSMSTGHDHDTTVYLHKRRDGDWPRAFLARPVAHAPGTHFLYNTGATYMLSAIIQRVTGMTLLEYLRPRLFEPLGIEGATWERCPRGVNTGGFGLSITTEDIARFGQLYLQRGVWQGRQLIPAAWVAAASAKQVSNASNTEVDWQQGYGYQFWRCRHDAYRGDGAFGQFCVILPEQDAVVAITAGTPNMQAVLNLVWAHLLPALAPAPRAEDVAAQEVLTRKLSSLALSPVQGQPSSSVAPTVSGRQYHFTGKRAPLRAISFDFGRDEDACTVQDDRGEHRVICGRGAWAAGITTWVLTHPHPTARDTRLPVVASGAWTAENTYELRLYYTETPFCFTIVCKFVADKVKLKFRINVSFGPTEFPQLTGQIGPSEMQAS